MDLKMILNYGPDIVRLWSSRIVLLILMCSAPVYEYRAHAK